MKKLNYIDGIKVIATWIVFNNHFLSAFLPVLVYGRESKDIYTNLQEIQLSESAISILWGGHYAVTLFFLISAFLISYQLFTSKKFFTMKECLLKIVKRYLKFVIPILVMNVFVLLFLKLRLFMNDDIVEMVKSSYLWLGRLYHFNDNIWDCIYNALVEVIFLGDNKYNNALWTMTHEFYGSVLVYCIFYVIQMIRKVDERGGGVIQRVCYYTIIIICMSIINPIMCCFVLGMGIADLYVNAKDALIIIFMRKDVKIVLIFGCIIFGCYPYIAGNSPQNYYKYLSFWDSIFPSYQIYHILGAWCLLMLSLFSGVLQKIMSGNLLMKLKNYTYSFYLLHIPLICSLGCDIYRIAFVDQKSYLFSIGSVYTLTLMITLTCSVVFSNTVEKYTNIIVGKVNISS